MFLQEHQPLGRGLWQLRRQSPALFQRDVPIPEEVEHQIRRMSSGSKIGKSWQDERSTTFFCDDQELVGHMSDLVRCVNQLQRPQMSGPRRLEFIQSDRRAQAIDLYLEAWEAFSNCVHRHDNWGL